MIRRAAPGAEATISYQMPALTFTQIGLITLAFQFTASLLQPLVGLYTDRRPLSLRYRLIK